MFEKLNKMFGERYLLLFQSINKNIIQTDPDTEGVMTIPIVNLGSGGATVSAVTPEPVVLNPAASVEVATKRVKAQNITYRIRIPQNEALLASEKPEYFNYLFDNILNKALIGYHQTFGGPDISRFGRVYCTPERPGGFIQQNFDENIEIHLVGQWAGNEEVTNEQGN